MKIIQQSALATVTATSEDASYPATNLLDEHPKRQWRAASSAVSAATLSFTTGSVTGGFALFGVVADRASVLITDPNSIWWDTGIEWEEETTVVTYVYLDDADTLDDTETITDTESTEIIGTGWSSVTYSYGESWSASEDNVVREIEWTNDVDALWVDFQDFEVPVAITVDLYKDAGTAATLAAGVAVAGVMVELPNPEYGLQQGLVDYSIVRELANGATYVKKRDIVRTFSGSFVVERAGAMNDFLLDTAMDLGMASMAWKVVDDDGTDWLLYGRLASMPGVSHFVPGYARVDFEIREVL